ncbi:hypothetical protein GCM10027277_12120 [Pseudoduganella ginsengisoli]
MHWRRPDALAGAALLACLAGMVPGAAQAMPNFASSGNAGLSRFCDKDPSLTVAEESRLLRFAAIVRQELSAGDSDIALISRSGLDLSRFGIRYSHAALAWRATSGAWSARQLYYACDEGMPRIFDQGVAGFTMGTDNPELGYISAVRLPRAAADELRPALLDGPRVLNLLATQYSANAYAYSLRYQNCNQWVAEMLAVAWSDMPDGPQLRARAQDWLRANHYAPEPVPVGSRILMWLPAFVPLLHVDDHPQEDRDALRLRVSLPASLETFMRQRVPGSDRVEICHNDKQIVVHHGWEPMAEGCQAGPGDRVVKLD